MKVEVMPAKLPPNFEEDLVEDSLSWMGYGSCLIGALFWDALTVDEQCDICKKCPVINNCLKYGIEIGADGVVYGGRMFKTKIHKGSF